CRLHPTEGPRVGMSEPTIVSPSELYPPLQVFAAQPPRRRTWVYVLFFLLTVFTTLVVGARMEYYFRQSMPALSMNEDAIGVFPLPWALERPSWKGARAPRAEEIRQWHPR